jgi:hypothetical protein
MHNLTAVSDLDMRHNDTMQVLGVGINPNATLLCK